VNSNGSVPARIMVVDDTPDNLKLLEGMLSELGYHVRAFPCGRLALSAAKREPPDLILLDVNMPEMNGYEVCEQLKADPELQDIPVLFISALTETVDKLKAFQVGGLDYVTKPFQFEEVHARIKAHLHLRGQQLDNAQLLAKACAGLKRAVVLLDHQRESQEASEIDQAQQQAKAANARNYFPSEDESWPRRGRA
jgi:DNA-binding response OmpR family regulator